MPTLPKIIQGKFKVLFNKKVGRDYFRMAIRAPRIVQQAQAGQFVHLRCQDNAEPLLRRPFSFHRLGQHNFEILYKIVGRGTNLLAKKGKSDIIDLLGPLGNGFDIKLPITNYQLPITILVAGGMGVAPLLALAEKLAYSVERIADRKKIVILLGAKTKNSVLCERDFKRLGARVQIATDDGSKGYKGLATDLLKKVLLTTNGPAYTKAAAGRQRPTRIYACGPKAMLKEITQISLHFCISAYGSLEENMACGVGACLGCVIRTGVGYKRVCKDGPVFNLQEIKW